LTRAIHKMYYLCMSNNSRAINITLPDELVREIDKAAKGEYASRSDFIRESVVRRLKNQRIVDEWGDSGNWEAVVDFRDLPGGGMPAEELLKRLKHLHGQDR